MYCFPVRENTNLFSFVSTSCTYVLLFLTLSPFVTDAPVVGLSLGRSMKADRIKEGDDAYFECSIEANPSFHRVDWRHNVSLLQ
ncbi:hypothetical protein E2C01_085969 [Portunus trituberculatus]|uniref:Ig-like domain-containing protein n=1 Tax=Portunus trituberculatus TaxID=210409 RepID=A0A5B7IZI5_PORTR|nr:hypothetical protein [Portunus trituberculatus]